MSGDWTKYSSGLLRAQVPCPSVHYILIDWAKISNSIGGKVWCFFPAFFLDSYCSDFPLPPPLFFWCVCLNGEGCKSCLRLCCYQKQLQRIKKTPKLQKGKTQRKTTKLMGTGKTEKRETYTSQLLESLWFWKRMVFDGIKSVVQYSLIHCHSKSLISMQ